VTIQVEGFYRSQAESVKSHSENRR
jgi:hypothetical protein